VVVKLLKFVWTVVLITSTGSIYKVGRCGNVVDWERYSSILADDLLVLLLPLLVPL